MVSRRAFFTRKEQQNFIHPPWTDKNFTTLCTQCNNCIKICPKKILYQAQDAYPAVNFSQAACDFCHLCAEVCPTKAIDVQRGFVWYHKLNISAGCLAKQGISCRSCVDACQDDAFIIRLKLQGKINISIEQAQCTRCGGCIGVCPVNAITPETKQLRKD